MRKRRVLALVMASLLAISSLVGCGEEAVSTDKVATSATSAVADKPDDLAEAKIVGETVVTDELADEIHVALNAQPPTLDCVMTTAAISAYVSTHIFEKLVSLKTDYTVGLELAESYEHNDDYTEQTYVLRQGVKFHNGKEMTSEDVVASINRWIDNYSAVKNMVGESRFEAVDTYTVKITTEKPCMYINEVMGYLGNAFISPKEVVEATPAGESLVEYIGTGPYVFTEWATDKYIRLDKFEDYVSYTDEVDGWWGKKEANIPTIIYEIVTDDSTRVAGMVSGDYDVAFNMPNDNYSMLNAAEDVVTYSLLWAQPMVIFNKAEGISTDVNFRKAVQAALNMDDIMTAGYSSPDFFNLNGCDMFSPQSEWFTEAGSEYYNMKDTELAKKFLSESSYSGETFKLLVSSDYTDLMSCAVVIEDELEAIGINVEIESYDWATFLTYRSDPSTFDAYVSTYVPVMVPSMTLYLGETYAGWYADEKAQGLMAQIAASTDSASAKALFEELETYNAGTTVPSVKLGEAYIYFGASSKLADVGTFQAPTFLNAKLYK